MVSLDKAILATYEHSGEHFELYVDPNNAYLYLDGSKKDLKNILVVDEVFKNAKKGERHKSEILKKAFETTDIIEILEIILKKGHVQLTTEQRKKKLEEKRKEIITILARETIDPRTKAPLPRLRIENAFEEAKVHVDPFKDAKEQIPEVVKALRLILPMKFEKVMIAVRIPAEHAQRCYGTVKNYGIKREEWAKSGDLIVVIEIPAGIQAEVYDKLNKMTGGTVETKIIER
ncbi:ribosome assembly factor SBDS [Candidatus Micrarchaeota archaeon]|nr:ribosome assembly factor SBDS [Candidatus Micrarchaeota archaeon]